LEGVAILVAVHDERSSTMVWLASKETYEDHRRKPEKSFFRTGILFANMLLKSSATAAAESDLIQITDIR
jgi:hypothetical protein